MSKFFIHRPIFAWVIAIFVILAGLVSITMLPVSQYPLVAPPTIRVISTYPGADAKTIDETVNSLIEREMNGIDGLMYMDSKAMAIGMGELSITFKPGTDPDMAQVDVQNRLSRAEPRLPAMVKQIGVQVDKAQSSFLAIVAFHSKDPAISPDDISDYVKRNILPELLRLPGVGNAQLFGAGRAMRIWVDPAKLEGYGLSMDDVNSAIRLQNMQISAGSLGAAPAVPGQAITATINVPGQLSTPEEFGNVVLRAKGNGSAVRIRDVAQVELGAESYSLTSRVNGKPGVALGIQLSASGNALDTVAALEKRMGELAPFMPNGVEWSKVYDTSKFVSISIQKVAMTLVEAMALVFIVMFIFLQNWRYTVIPSIVVPIALLGTFAVMLAAGMLVNILAMFAMVLVIGIVVDDAIVVVENVERIMAEEGLSPKAATLKAMGQISGAVVGITVILVVVFLPLSFFTGATGNIYRQFSAVMVASISFSAFMALTLTPALCATLLKPVEAGHHHEKKGFFGWFNRSFNRTSKRYQGLVARTLRGAGRTLIIYGAIAAAAAVIYQRLPTSFLPSEDQGYIIVNVQLPPGATQERTLAVMEQIEGFVLKQEEVANMVSVLGFSFSGEGQNMGLAFVPLKPWDERTGAAHSADALAGRIMGAMAGVRDAFIFALNPPPIPELGNATGFTFRLQDRNGAGHDALVNARNQLLGMAMQSKVLAQVHPDGLEDAPQLQIDIDRDKANALGVGFDAINSALSTALGSSYVNDFPSQGRMQRVVVQAEATGRMQGDDLLAMHVRNAQGQTLPLSTFASTRWIKGAQQTVRYNGYPAMRIAGGAAPGFSTGDAMAEMERLAAQLPPGFGYEWTGQSREEKLAGSQALVLYGFAVLAVFLCLAALYESWSIPLSVILVVPLGVLGVLLAILLRGYTNDVYFQVGLITVIGLSAKNAILIIEFAKDLQAQGKSVAAAALQAAQLRFRPIVMTSMAFGLGVLPLVLASGAGAASQRAIGTGVLGGVITGTVLAVIFVPVFFVVVRTVFKGSARQQEMNRRHALEAGIGPQTDD